MKSILSFFRKKKKCGLCGDILGANPGMIRYTVTEHGHYGFLEDKTCEMDICTECSDVLDKGTKE